MGKYEVIVVGAGHAGVEAALAAARSGRSTLMLTMDRSSVGRMSCNPAIGGIGKGHLVREIDALGGEMARAIDACGIQFRRLNTRKGPAVQATRAQADRQAYADRMLAVVTATPNLTLGEAEVVALELSGDRIRSVVTSGGSKLTARAVVVTTGTFLRGLMHFGDRRVDGGRAGEPSSGGLSAALENLGLELGRMKTGTCPRLDSRSIDYRRLEEQRGDEPAPLFSFDGKRPLLDQRPCHITYTNSTTHSVIRDNIKLSAIYNGDIVSRGPRYCPSIEDKVVKFADRDQHRIFLEPEGLRTFEVYPNGLSTALPLEVQKSFLATIEGLAAAVITKPGYAIEYDYVEPTQLTPSLETRQIKGLYLAGQINGSTGYEEAAAQGLMAGINAVRSLDGLEPMILGREQAYIGVLIDDLVTRGVEGEPYRMFTSRAEFRLLLREGNADLRLAGPALESGLLGPSRRRALTAKRRTLARGRRVLMAARVNPGKEVTGKLDRLGQPAFSSPLSAYELLARPGLGFKRVARLCSLESLGAEVEAELEVEARYAGYVRRQQEEVRRLKGLENTLVPDDMDYGLIDGLSREASEKLARIRPRSLGQASRISGLTPAAVSVLAMHMRKTASS